MEFVRSSESLPRAGEQVCAAHTGLAAVRGELIVCVPRRGNDSCAKSGEGKVPLRTWRLCPPRLRLRTSLTPQKMRRGLLPRCVLRVPAARVRARRHGGRSHVIAVAEIDRGRACAAREDCRRFAACRRLGVVQPVRAPRREVRILTARESLSDSRGRMRPARPAARAAVAACDSACALAACWRGSSARC